MQGYSMLPAWRGRLLSAENRNPPKYLAMWIFINTGCMKIIYKANDRVVKKIFAKRYARDNN